MENEKLLILKRIGVRWSALTCFCQALCEAKINAPRSVDNKLQVARCIIETGCSEIREAEPFLDEVENTLIKNASDGGMENVNSWIRFLKKTKEDLPDRKELMEIPFMRALLQNYEFLSYCISP